VFAVLLLAVFIDGTRWLAPTMKQSRVMQTQ